MLAAALMLALGLQVAAASLPGENQSPARETGLFAILDGVLRLEKDGGFVVETPEVPVRLVVDSKDSNSTARLKNLVNAKVILSGPLRVRAGTVSMQVGAIAPAGDRRQRLVEEVRKAGECVVSYRPGRDEEVVDLCKALGLTVKENYALGNFLVCRWNKDVSLPDAIKALESNHLVNYVVANSRLEISPSERPGKR